MDISSYVRSKMKAEALKTPFSNQTASFFTFRRGDAVYYLDKSAEKGKCSKLKPIWTIMTALTPYTYKVKFKNKDLKVVNHARLKICSDRELPTWIAMQTLEMLSDMITELMEIRLVQYLYKCLHHYYFVC